MSERMCVVCHEKPGRFQCRQCHRLVCDECAFKVTDGAFCGRDCAAKFVAFKKHHAAAEAARGGSVMRAFKLLVSLVLLTIIAGAVYVYGAKHGWFGEDTQGRVIEKQRQIERQVKDK